MQQYLEAGKVVTTHGVRGEMKALPLCDGAQSLTPDAFDDVMTDVKKLCEFENKTL